MSFLGFILLGLIAGAIAKLILPGRQGGGWLATLVLGVIGALIGGWIGGAVFNVGYDGFFSIQSWIIAILGALVVLVIWGLITGRRGAARVVHELHDDGRRGAGRHRASRRSTRQHDPEDPAMHLRRSPAPTSVRPSTWTDPYGRLAVRCCRPW